jgi:hypothetical protein
MKPLKTEVVFATRWFRKLRWQYGQRRVSVNGSPQKSKATSNF